MPFSPDHTDSDFATWLASVPTEDELRDAYVRLEASRASLWTAGTLDSFRRDRYERDARCVAAWCASSGPWPPAGKPPGSSRAPHPWCSNI